MEPQEVVLTSQPDGCSTRGLPLTVGNVYRLLGRDGSNVIITTDDPELTASIWRGRVSFSPTED